MPSTYSITLSEICYLQGLTPVNPGHVTQHTGIENPSGHIFAYLGEVIAHQGLFCRAKK